MQPLIKFFVTLFALKTELTYAVLFNNRDAANVEKNTFLGRLNHRKIRRWFRYNQTGLAKMDAAMLNLQKEFYETLPDGKLKVVGAANKPRPVLKAGYSDAQFNDAFTTLMATKITVIFP